MISASTLKIDITPTNLTKIYVAGFSHNKPASGIHKPIYARILCLEDESGPLVMIALDLIGLPRSDLERIRLLCGDVPSDRIFAASTHTHAGPDTIGLWGKHLFGLPVINGRDEEYISWMINRIADGVRNAAANVEPVQFGFAEDKSDKINWIVNIQVEGPAYYDNTVSVMKVVRPDGTPVACLSNFACHPESLSDSNTEISPDFVGYMHDLIERETGAVSIFFNGALGAMVTANTNLESGDVPAQRAFAEALGNHMGGIVSTCWESSVAQEIDSFSTRSVEIRVPVTNRRFRLFFRLGLLPGEMKRGRLLTSLFWLAIGEAQMASLPGEAAPGTGFAAKELMPARYKFLVGLGNDELGYLLNEVQYNDRENYAYERTVSIGSRGLEVIMQRFAELVRSRPLS